ncbi:hypothetical protein FUAX_34970 [Fulvitalea axinellae]|uniref:Uncharacterized protein n=1 Tax=Fulvitalea axinellae TaxID=1182444 RepID=A0AAU9DIU0_9BACT|nr:hypothetical protein FUAX_34970 [Fulvitalea axinellae]
MATQKDCPPQKTHASDTTEETSAQRSKNVKPSQKNQLA